MFWNVFVLIRTKLKKHWAMIEEVLKVKGTKMSYAILGQCGIAAYNKFANMPWLTEITMFHRRMELFE